MRFSLALLSNVLLTGSAFAGLAQRRERRAGAARLRKTQPASRIGTSTVNALDITNNTNVQYTSNWAGAALTAPPAGSTFTAISAKFTVPKPSGSGSASAWVGIDGDTYAEAILQTGVDFTVRDGAITFDAWYEWYPDYAYNFPPADISVSAGDVFSISVTSTNSSAGEAVIENLTTKQRVSKFLTAPLSQWPKSVLGGQNAEWIVEDFEQNGAQVQLVNFGNVVFTDAVATTSKGVTMGPSRSTILDMRQGGIVLTTSSSEGSTVTVNHNGV